MQLRYIICAGFITCGPAMAQDVYPGCEQPTPVSNHHTFFIDPSKGTDSGDGSITRPWKSLNTVLAPASKMIATKSHKTLTGSPLLDVNPAAPIRSGDIIMLMSGDYGDVTLTNAFNDKFITIMPAPGQKPTIQHLNIGGAARWMFQGLTFQSEYPSGAKQNAKIQVIVNDGWGDKTNNIVFNSNVFQTEADASAWSDADWYSKPNFYTVSIRSSCTAFTNSMFQNLLNGFSVAGSQTLIKNNTFRKFSNDAIDVAAGNVTIVGNLMKEAMHNPTSALHPDAIQIWTTAVAGKIDVLNSNILIDSNQVYMAKSPDGKRGILQGITVGFCDNVTIQNNVVATNLIDAIYANGLTNSKIVNNTVIASDPAGFTSRIVVTPSKYNASKNVVVQNNIANYIFALDTSVTMDHNIALTNMTTFEAGKAVWHPTGIPASQNLIQPTLTTNFRNWAPAQGGFDFHLKNASALAETGSSLLAPSLDADGLTRATPFTLGAYAR